MLIQFFKELIFGKPKVLTPFLQEWADYLQQKVSFYRNLSADQQLQFQKRVSLFLSSTEIVGNGLEVDDHDRLLVAASAIIPVWAFTNWHYFNLHTVILLPASFNEDICLKEDNSYIEGMVGTGYMKGKMLLSRNALHYGFSNNRDKRNVGIHEFSHLIDMSDGDCDGFPERLKEFSFSIPWLNLVKEKVAEIHEKDSNINPYGATNDAEFFSVATEYFFERGQLMQKKHPQLYQSLQDFYQQDTASITQTTLPKKNSACSCGSGKKYKRCCMPEA